MTQPCFVPLVTLKDAEESPLDITDAFIPSWKDVITLSMLSGIPSFLRIFQGAVQFTVLKVAGGNFVHTVNISGEFN